tara:strand:+ start:6034 stop:7473 length:1440 start_codon:yes stop_codon:yes gene_type:complete
VKNILKRLKFIYDVKRISDTDIAGHIPLIYKLASKIKPRVIIQNGVRNGNSGISLAIAQLENNNLLVDIDLIDLMDDDMREIRNTVSNNWINFIGNVQSTDILAELQEHKGKVDLFFSDTSHNYEDTLFELEHYMPLLSPTGIMLMHDLDPWNRYKGQARALDEYFTKHPEWNWCVQTGNCGLGIFYRDKKHLGGVQCNNDVGVWPYGQEFKEIINSTNKLKKEGVLENLIYGPNVQAADDIEGYINKFIKKSKEKKIIKQVKTSITLKTNHPIAIDSPDHIFPHGTKHDNSTNEGFINDILEYNKIKGKKKINFLDLGCSGGQLVIDILNRGNFSVGLEGSDYSVKHKRANWPEYHNKNLFTCDITKPYKLYNYNQPVQFDTITAWEVIEHIHPNNLKNFFKNINDNLCSGGFFCGSISTNEDVVEGHKLHQSVFTKEEWFNMIPNILKETDLELFHYPFPNQVRKDIGSFHILLEKK